MSGDHSNQEQKPMRIVDGHRDREALRMFPVSRVRRLMATLVVVEQCARVPVEPSAILYLEWVAARSRCQ